MLIFSYSPNSGTYLNVEIIYFAGSSFSFLNKCYSQSDMQSLGAHLNHVYSVMC